MQQDEALAACACVCDRVEKGSEGNSVTVCRLSYRTVDNVCRAHWRTHRQTLPCLRLYHLLTCITRLSLLTSLIPPHALLHTPATLSSRLARVTLSRFLSFSFFSLSVYVHVHVHVYPSPFLGGASLLAFSSHFPSSPFSLFPRSCFVCVVRCLLPCGGDGSPGAPAGFVGVDIGDCCPPLVMVRVGRGSWLSCLAVCPRSRDKLLRRNERHG